MNALLLLLLSVYFAIEIIEICEFLSHVMKTSESNRFLKRSLATFSAKAYVASCTALDNTQSVSSISMGFVASGLL